MNAIIERGGWSGRFTPLQRLTAFTILVLSMLFLLNVGNAHAAAPAAGTPIGNQASATYNDASGNAQPPVTSNTVVTKVTQVASFTLTATQTKPAPAGSTVYFPHTLTNTGNGSDTFDLSAAIPGGGGFTPSSVQLYADANGDGIPDNATPISSSGPLAAGSVFKFVAAVLVPGGASGSANVTVSAVGNAAAAAGAVPPYTAAGSQTNTDTTSVTANAVINVTKSMSALSGQDGSGPYTVTLTYTNTGNATATAVTIGDVIPAGMSYVSNSGRWSVSGATPLTDNTGAPADPAGIAYDFNVTLANRVSAVVTSVAPGVSGTVSFQINIPVGTAPGGINNTATVAYNDGAANVGPFNSNTVSFAVLQRGSVVLDDVGSAANGLAGNLVADSDPAADVVGVASAPQGATVQFDNVVHNTGNGTDSFDITLSASSFPAGTSFQLYKSDGATPLTDTNGNGTADTGPVAPGAAYHVIVKAILPAGASGNNGGAGFTEVKTAKSFFDPTKSDTVTDKLAAISASSVDLTNNSARQDSTPAGTANAGNAGTTGFGAGTASVVVSQSVNPGASTTFQLFVNNTSLVADNYDLTVTSALPAGWTVAFKADGGAGNCSTTGATITNTGIINNGANKLVCAVVSVPASGAGAVAGVTNLTFRSASAASGALDTIIDAVTVNAVHNVTLTPNNSGQAVRGGTVVYTHTITNNGNTTENITFAAGFLADSQAGWTSTLFRDNGTTSGSLDAGDTAVDTTTTFALAPGASATLFIKVFAPNAAAVGQVDDTTATASYNGGAAQASANDSTTVIAGNLQLNKTQALDAACDGIADTAFGNAAITAKPGGCIRYQITATNVGATNLTGVVVSDATPANTVYNTGAQCFPVPAPAGTAGATTTAGSIASVPANCAIGSVSVNVGTLTPAQSAVITFGVQITQ